MCPRIKTSIIVRALRLNQCADNTTTVCVLSRIKFLKVYFRFFITYLLPKISPNGEVSGCFVWCWLVNEKVEVWDTSYVEVRIWLDRCR